MLYAHATRPLLLVAALMLGSAAYADPAAHLSAQAPQVAPEHQQRMDDLWERAARGSNISTRCAHYGAQIQNPFDAKPLSPEQVAQATQALEACYVLGFSRYIHYYLEKRPDGCNRLVDSMVVGQGVVLGTLDDPARRTEWREKLKARIGSDIQRLCPKQASLILDE